MTPTRQAAARDDVAAGSTGGITALHDAREDVPIQSPSRRPALVAAVRGTALGRVGAAVDPVALLGAALLIWALSLRAVDPHAIGATGLVSVLPAGTLIALGVATVSFGVSLVRTRIPTWVLMAHVVVLIVMLYALAGMVEPEPAFEPAYRHVGIADSIARTGGFNTTVDAYFSWPGFFILTAFLTRVAGLHDALGLVRWAPLAYSLLYLAPLVLILRALTTSRRLIFLALWLFYAANWTAQEYFSPQATAYLLYLVVLGILLRWFTPPFTPATPGRRAALLATAITAMVVIVGMHQLTPFAVLLSVTALVLGAGCTARLLPVLVAALIGAWGAFMALGFMSGNLANLLGGLGDLGGTVHANIDARIGGDAGHRLVVDARLALTGVVLALAVVGWLALRRRGHRVRAATAAGVAPLPLFALQSYGGEILIRVWLFALPFAAFLAAASILAVPRGPSVRATAAIATAMLVVTGAFLFARFGNERMDAFSTGDVAGVHALYRLAPRGSELVAASQPLPWQSRSYTAYDYERLTDLLPGLPPPRRRPHRPLSYRIRDVLRSTVPGHAYIIVTRSQIAGDDLTGTTGTPARLVAQRLSVSRIFRVAYRARDAVIFVLRDRPGAGG